MLLRIIADSCSVYCIFLPFVYRGKAFCYDMKSRPTRNSQVAAFDAMISPVESNLSSLAVNSSLPSTGSADPYATSQSPMSDQPSPAFLAAVVTVVKQALAAEETSNLPSTPATSFASSLPMVASLGAFLVCIRFRLLLANSMPKPQAWQPLALVFRLSHRLL